MGRNSPSFPEPHQCTERGPAFKDTSLLPYHARNEHVGKRFMCPRCPCTYASKGGLTEHVRHIHENASRYRCDTCGKRFSIRLQYYDHLAAHTGVKQYVCSVCLKKFTVKRNLEAHMLHFHPAEIAHEKFVRVYCGYSSQSGFDALFNNIVMVIGTCLDLLTP